MPLPLLASGSVAQPLASNSPFNDETAQQAKSKSGSIDVFSPFNVGGTQNAENTRSPVGNTSQAIQLITTLAIVGGAVIVGMKAFK